MNNNNKIKSKKGKWGRDAEFIIPLPSSILVRKNQILQKGEA